MFLIEWIVLIMAIVIALLAFLSIDYIHRDLFHMRFKTRAFSIVLLVIIIAVHESTFSKLHLVWIIPVLYNIMHIVAEHIVKPITERRK